MHPIVTRLPLGKRDLLAVILILMGYFFALIIMPVQHDFAIMDDWTYVHSAEQIVLGQGFSPSEYAQATMATHVYWGALFATLFGASFTTFTAATMVMSLTAALTFYILLRRLNFTPGLSGLGVALLTLNPYFINLSYSFMTEITFLALLLLSCLFFFEGLSGRGEWWLWLGSIFTALTFLTRQFGLAVALAALLWLLYARKLNLRRLLAVALVPAIVAAIYFVWSSRFPITFSGSVSREEIRQLRSPSAWVNRAAHFAYLELGLPGLLVPLFGKVRHWRIIAALSAGAAVAVFVLWQVKLKQVQEGTGTLNELSTFWLQPLTSNPALIFSAGAALTVWLVTGLTERSWPCFVALMRRRREPQPVDFLYLVGIILFLGTYLISSGFLDRYWLPVLPFLIIGGLTWVRGRSWLGLLPAFVLLAVLATFGVLVRMDQYDSLGASWQAGRWLVAQDVPYDKMTVNYTWDGYYLYDEPKRRLGTLDISVVGRISPVHEIVDPEYVVDTNNRRGYHVVKTLLYFSRLGGFANRQLYIMKRD